MADLTKPDVSAGQTIEGADVGELYDILLGDSNYDNLKPNGVKTWVGLLTAVGTGDPTATVIYNTLGGTIAFTRTGTGLYQAALSSAWVANKTIIFVALGSTGSVGKVLSARYNADNIVIAKYNAAGDLADGFTNLQFKVEVYP